MGFKEEYEAGKPALLNDPTICKENRELFKKFFEYEEYKLKRKNGLANLDNSAYKTLRFYISRFKTVNKWFGNKPWKKLTKKDIKQVYDGLEDGKIFNRFGKPFNTSTFYNTIIRSKPFEMAGKKEVVKEVMEFYHCGRKEEVRFIKEETFRSIIEVIRNPIHRLFIWLCWDIGENSFSILQLKKNDFVRQINSDTKEAEYIVNLRKEILKRSRTPRSEITNCKETVQLLDIHLKDKQDTDALFEFGQRQAEKVLDHAGKKVNAVCIPKGQKVTLKDLRSSMACHLLSKGLSTDEVNARLGHKPSSREIDKYINYLALDRSKPKKKIFDNQVAKLSIELEEVKEREKLNGQRMEKMSARLQGLEKMYDEADKNGYSILIRSEYYPESAPHIEKAISNLDKAFKRKRFEEMKKIVLEKDQQ